MDFVRGDIVLRNVPSREYAETVARSIGMNNWIAQMARRKGYPVVETAPGVLTILPKVPQP